MSDRVEVSISNIEEYSQFILNNPVVILKASAVNCGPCKTIIPLFKDEVSKLPPRVSIIYIDINDAPTIARKYRIRYVPCMLSIINGEPEDIIVGAKPEGIRDFFNKVKKRIGC
jgi:thioredoxin-like negative regulator of GroEL